MPIGDKQKLITDIVATVLNQQAQDVSFGWFINKHTMEHFKEFYPTIEIIFKALNGNSQQNQSKGIQHLKCDTYFGGKYNFMFEFDEFQHFSSARLKTLELYPSDIKVSFDLNCYKQWCLAHRRDADNYRHSKTTRDFNFEGGRTCQRAYLDCFRDILPPIHGLAPTLRIAEFEVASICANNRQSQDYLKELIGSKLPS